MKKICNTCNRLLDISCFYNTTPKLYLNKNDEVMTYRYTSGICKECTSKNRYAKLGLTPKGKNPVAEEEIKPSADIDTDKLVKIKVNKNKVKWVYECLLENGNVFVNNKTRELLDPVKLEIIGYIHERKYENGYIMTVVKEY